MKAHFRLSSSGERRSRTSKGVRPSATRLDNGVEGFELIDLSMNAAMSWFSSKLGSAIKSWVIEGVRELSNPGADCDHEA